MYTQCISVNSKNYFKNPPTEVINIMHQYYASKQRLQLLDARCKLAAAEAMQAFGRPAPHHVIDEKVAAYTRAFEELLTHIKEHVRSLQ